MIYKLSLLIITCVSIVIVYLWNSLMPKEYYNSHVYAVVLFFALFSFISTLFLSSSMNAENKNAFTLRFIAASGVKLFISLFVIIIYAFLNKKQVVSFAILYLFIYFLFTGVETFFLYRATRKKSN